MSAVLTICPALLQMTAPPYLSTLTATSHRKLSASNTSEHLQNLAEPTNRYQPPQVGTIVRWCHLDYVDWDGERFPLPREMVDPVDVPWVPKDAMMYGRMGKESEGAERQEELGDILERLEESDTSRTPSPFSRSDTSTSLPSGFASPLLTHSSTLKVTPLHASIATKPTPCEQSVKDMDFGKSPRESASIETPGTSPASSRLATPGAEHDVPLANVDSSHSAVCGDWQSPCFTKRSSSPNYILGQLNSLELLYPSSAFADSDAEAEEGNRMGSRAQDITRSNGGTVSQHVTTICPAFTHTNHYTSRSQSHPPAKARTSRGSGRRRGESLPFGAKAPFLRRSLPVQLFDIQPNVHSHDDEEDPLDVLAKAATGYEGTTPPEGRFVSPECSRAQALSHRLGHISTSWIRTTASRLTIPSSPTTRDEWDTDTDDYAPRPTPPDGRLRVPDSVPVFADANNSQEGTLPAGSLGVQDSKPSEQHTGRDDREDKQSVLDAIARAQDAHEEQVTCSFPATRTSRRAEALKRKRLAEPESDIRAVSSSDSTMPGSGSKRVKRVADKAAPKAASQADAISEGLPRPRVGWAYEFIVEHDDIQTTSTRPLNKLARDRGWESIPHERNRKSRQVKSTGDSVSAVRPDVFVPETRCSRKKQTDSAEGVVPGPGVLTSAPGLKGRAGKCKTAQSSTRTAGEDELNLKFVWSEAEDEIVLCAWDRQTSLSHQVEDIREALLRRGFDRSAGAIKYRLTHKHRAVYNHAKPRVRRHSRACERDGPADNDDGDVASTATASQTSDKRPDADLDSREHHDEVPDVPGE